MIPKTHEEVLAFAQKHNEILGKLAHEGYKRLGLGMVIISDERFEDPLVDERAVDGLYVTYLLPITPDLQSNQQLQMMMRYDPCKQYIVMTLVNNQYLFVLIQEPNRTPYELFLKGQTAVDRPLKTVKDLDLLLEKNIKWISPFAYRCFRKFGRGLILIRAAESPEKLVEAEQPIETEVSTRVNNHVFCTFMPYYAFSNYIDEIGDSTSIKGQVLQAISGYDPDIEFIIGFDNGETTLYKSHSPQKVENYPSYFCQQARRRGAAHRAAESAPEFNRELHSTEETTALIESNFDQLIGFSVINHAKHGRGIIFLESAAVLHTPHVTDDASFFAINEHNAFTFIPLLQYLQSEAYSVSGLQGLRMLLGYNPDKEFICTFGSKQQSFTRRYQITGDVQTLRRNILETMGMDGYMTTFPVDSLAVASLQAMITAVYERLSAFSFKGYKKVGRGAVIVLPKERSKDLLTWQNKVRLPLQEDQIAVYVPTNELDERIEVTQWLWNKLNIYNHSDEFIVVHVHASGAASYEHVRDVMPPRKAYKIHLMEINALFDQ